MRTLNFVVANQQYANMTPGTRYRVTDTCRDAYQLQVKGKPVWVPMNMTSPYNKFFEREKTKEIELTADNYAAYLNF